LPDGLDVFCCHVLTRKKMYHSFLTFFHDVFVYRTVMQAEKLLYELEVE